jgi:hypothetical protein
MFIVIQILNVIYIAAHRLLRRKLQKKKNITIEAHNHHLINILVKDTTMQTTRCI